MKIRCCVAYGCQENDTLDRKDAFWTYLDEEVDLAEQNETGFVLQFDGNLWAGSQMIPGDPRQQNKNGKMFQEFLEQHPHLTVVNSLPPCEGLITRSRARDDEGYPLSPPGLWGIILAGLWGIIPPLTRAWVVGV